MHINAHWRIKGVFGNLVKFVYKLGKNWQTRALFSSYYRLADWQWQTVISPTWTWNLSSHTVFVPSTGLWQNTWIHVSPYLVIIRNSMHILWSVNYLTLLMLNFIPKGWRHVQGIYANNVHKSNRQKHNKNRK